MTQIERAEVPVVNPIAALEHLMNRLAGMEFRAGGTPGGTRWRDVPETAACGCCDAVGTARPQRV